MLLDIAVRTKGKEKKKGKKQRPGLNKKSHKNSTSSARTRKEFESSPAALPRSRIRFQQDHNRNKSLLRAEQIKITILQACVLVAPRGQSLL